MLQAGDSAELGLSLPGLPTGSADAAALERESSPWE